LTAKTDTANRDSDIFLKKLRKNFNFSIPSKGDFAFKFITLLSATCIPIFMGLIFYELISNSAVSINQLGWNFLVEKTWDPVHKIFGALPFIYGTILSSALALVIAIPVSLGIAIYLSEFSPKWLSVPLSFIVELLAAIPSVIYGLWGIFVLIPWLSSVVEPTLAMFLGLLPLFQGPQYGYGMLAGGLILAIMIIPTISAVSREALAAVPNSQREASFALGATKWETIQIVVIRYSRSGIIGATVLGLGRALGETMAITMVIGNRPEISPSLFAPSYTMASVIANEFAEATYKLYTSALIEIGLLLLIITILVNIFARLLLWRVKPVQKE
jgi:phosphate transport system permease protein